MLDAGLALSAGLMGLAGTPHCLAMCGAACAAAGRPAPWSFQAGRALGYAAAGAVAAGSVQLLGQMGRASALLQPLWVLVHVVALVLGLALLWRGRQPAWMMNTGRSFSLPVDSLRRSGGALASPARAGLFGLAWVAWPCGLLQSALLVAALATGPLQGAGVMGAFALTSGTGLAFGPWLLRRLLPRLLPGLAPRKAGGLQLSVRLGGLGLAGASAWALGHGLWQQIAAYCG